MGLRLCSSWWYWCIHQMYVKNSSAWRARASIFHKNTLDTSHYTEGSSVLDHFYGCLLVYHVESIQVLILVPLLKLTFHLLAQLSESAGYSVFLTEWIIKYFLQPTQRETQRAYLRIFYTLMVGPFPYENLASNPLLTWIKARFYTFTSKDTILITEISVLFRIFNSRTSSK